MGSFLNVCIWRLPRRQSVMAPRSYCPSCGRQLAWWELVPVVSYLVLGGRCRTCRRPISLQYPLVETATGVLYVLSVYFWGPGLHAVRTAVFGSLLIVAGVIDARHRIIPDVVTLPGFGVGLLLSALDPSVGLWSSLAGAALGGGLLLAVAVVSAGGMGGGDIKLAAMMGAFLGWAGLIVGLLAALVSGALVGGALVLAGVKGRKDLMAFGPFLAAGGLLAALYGPLVTTWYLGTFWG